MDDVLKHYNVGKLVIPVEHIKDGWMNVSHKLTTETGCYVLRQYVSNERRTPSIESISFELDYMTYLYNNGLAVPKIISAVNCNSNDEVKDRLLIRCDNKYYVLFAFINGIHYRNLDTSSRELWQVIDVAKFLGHMHMLTMNSNEYKLKSASSGRISLSFIQIKYDLLIKCEKFKLEQPAMYTRIENFLHEHTPMIPVTSDKNEQILFMTKFEENLPKACIHADFQELNVLFDSENKKLAAVLDFDGIYYGPLLVDTGLSVTHWCYEGRKLNEEFLKIFLYEYQKRRQMNLIEDEWNLLFLYCYLRNTHSLLFAINAYETLVELRPNILFNIEKYFVTVEYLSQLNQKELIQRIRTKLDEMHDKDSIVH